MEEELASATANADASIDIDLLPHNEVEELDGNLSEPAPDAERVIATGSETNHDIEPKLTAMQFDLPFIQPQKLSPVPFSNLGEVLYEKAVKRNGFAVIVPPAKNRWEYKVFVEDDGVNQILEEYDDAGLVEYLVLFSDGSEDVVSYFPGCSIALTHVPSAASNLTLNSRVIHLYAITSTV